MHLASVIGTATATVKHPSLIGWRLLVAQPLDAAGGDDGDPVLVVDPFGAGQGQRVMITSDGASVRELMKDDRTPVRWAVIGVIDDETT